MVAFLTLALAIAVIIFIILIRKRTSNLILKITLSVVFGVILTMMVLLIGYLYIAYHTLGFE
jgi:hypothetical protein